MAHRVEYDLKWFDEFINKYDLTVLQFLDLFECPSKTRTFLRCHLYPDNREMLTRRFMKHLRDFLDECKRKIENSDIDVSKIRQASIEEIVEDRYHKNKLLFMPKYQDPSFTCYIKMKDDTLTLMLEVRTDVEINESTKRSIDDIMQRYCLYDIKKYSIDIVQTTYLTGSL
jgi:hypothetical protein